MFKSKPSIIATAVLLSLGLSACGSSSDKKVETKPVNVAPTAITLSSNTVDENAKAAEIGTISVTDTAGDTHTFELSDDRFEINTDGVLKLKADMALNFEKEAEVKLTVTAKDNGGKTLAKELTISVKDLLDTYTFTSVFDTDKSSVSYGGQTARQVLIAQMKADIAGFTVDTFESKDLALAYLNGKYYGPIVAADATDADKKLAKDNWQSDWKDTYGATKITFVDEKKLEKAGLTLKQKTLRDINDGAKSLKEKVAGQDKTGQRVDWNKDGLKGFSSADKITPDAYVQQLFNQLADNLTTGGTRMFTGTDVKITKLYITADGIDLRQLLQKFLLGAVNFSQGTDDYLDSDIDGKGLLSNNVGPKGDAAYTTLEHTFDEGFGYFGAARDYSEYTDLEARGKKGRDAYKFGFHDTDGDKMIDLMSEINLSNSVNAAKRDVGSAGNPNATDLTQEAIDAFLAARKIINDNADHKLTEEQLTELKKRRDTAVLTWEKSIAATMVHYINDLTDDVSEIGKEGATDTEKTAIFSKVATHFSELKGFGLGLQFNPRSPVTAAKFAELHSLIRDVPELEQSLVKTYQEDLAKARKILKDAYKFDATNVENW